MATESSDDESLVVNRPTESPYQEFSDMPGMPDFLVKQLDKLGIIRPSPVQAGTIPQALNGQDIIGAARTGQGKTMCFVIPILASLAEDPGAFRGLILTPTRELAIQIGQQFQVLAESMKIRVLTIIGGVDLAEQQRALAAKPHVLIATPGRLAQIIKDGSVAAHVASLRRLKHFVLDEADRLLSAEFAEALGSIVSLLPEQRQTLLFSATLTQSIKTLMDLQNTLRKPHIYQDIDANELEAIKGEDGIDKWPTPDTLDMQYMFMPLNVKDCYLLYLIRKHLAELPTGLIIFVPTCQACEEITAMLNFAEPPVGAVRLHRWMKQRDRTHALQQFKQGSSKVLVATDLASRGLDIPDVYLVIQYNVPSDPRTYIHRVGRVARRGRKGHSIMLIDQHQVNFFLRIEQHLTRPVTEYDVDEKRVLVHLNETVSAREMGRLDLDDAGFYERLELLKSQKVQWEMPKNRTVPKRAEKDDKEEEESTRKDDNKKVKKRRHADPEERETTSTPQKRSKHHEKEGKRRRD